MGMPVISPVLDAIDRPVGNAPDEIVRYRRRCRRW